jgi:hypothetical protein
MSASFELKLHSGRGIGLSELHQTRTYGGVLEGLPTVEMNRRYLARLVSTAKARYGRNVHVIMPAETPIDLSHESTPYPFGTPAKFPRISCVACFESSSAARDQDLDYSELVVISLQEAFALPIAEPVLTRLLEIDREALATDLEY